jgi:hypothetical protein
MTYAFIVGIDKYRQQGWNTSGPCSNAIAIADWALTANFDGVYVYLQPQEEMKAAIDSLQSRKAIVRENAEWEGIDEFCFEELVLARPAGSRLLIFWSGHGYTNPDGERFFMCSDFTSPNFNNRVFNASKFLRSLRTPTFHCFSETLLLADACAPPSPFSIRDPRETPPGGGDRRQLAFFASPEGKYAYGTEGRGRFTETALAALREVNAWPELRTFATALDGKLRSSNETPFRFEAFDDEVRTQSRIIGTPTGTPIFESVFAMLDKSGLQVDIFRRHYVRTAAKLVNPALNSAQGLIGMLRELSTLKDAESGGVAPRALLEFLVRLTQVPELAQPVNDWLEKTALNQATVVATLRAELDEENRARILLIEMEHDSAEAITGFTPYLRTGNLKPLTDPALGQRQVSDWPQCEREITDLIDMLGRDSIDQIQFIVNPPLFDRPFHTIPAPGGGVIGQRYVVTTRYRERLLWTNPRLLKQWSAYVDALRAMDPKDIAILALPPESPTSKARGFCYLNSPIAACLTGARVASKEKELLKQQLGGGVPFLCWIHRPPPVSWAEFNDLLKGCLDDAGTIDAIPDTFLEKRMTGNSLARETTLLWDDPLQNPLR